MQRIVLYASFPTAALGGFDYCIAHKSGVAKGVGGVQSNSVPGSSVTTDSVESNGVTRVVVILTGSLNAGDVLLHECWIRAQSGIRYNVLSAVVMWPLVVNGVDYWVFPEWLTDGQDTLPLPTHLLSDVGPQYWAGRPFGAGPAEYGSGAALQAGRAYRSSTTGYLSGSFSEVGPIGVVHSNPAAQEFKPTSRLRLLDNYAAPSVTVAAPEPAAAAVPATGDPATRADLASIEARFVQVQATLKSLAEAIVGQPTTAEFRNAISAIQANTRVVNESVGAVGNAVVAQDRPVAQRLGESFLTSAAAAVLLK